MGSLAQLLPFVLVFVVFYFLLIRPQQKRQRERASMLNALEAGAKIVTIGGVHGTIVALEDTTARVRIAENVEVVYERSAISQVKKAD